MTAGTLFVLILSVISTQQTRIPGSLAMPPQILNYTPPSYTDEALRRGIEGNVIVEAAFDSEGNFTVLRVVKGLGFGLDESALNALRNWRFAPAYRNGARVSAISQIDVAFKLPEEAGIRQKLMKMTETLREMHRLAEETSRGAKQVHEKLMKMKERNQ